MMLSYDIKFITNDESLQLKHSEFKSSKYETKKRVDETVYEAGKRDFCEHRGGHWIAPRPRQIRQLEAKLRDRSIVVCEWSNESFITIVFSSGAIAYLSVKPNTLDVTQVLFDRYCVGKLSGQTVTGVVFSKTHLLFLHTDKVATLVSFGKNVTSLPCKISDRDPNIQTIELGGGSRRGERKVSWCENGGGVRVLVWGASIEPAPWSPALEDRANLHVYQLTGQQRFLVAYHQLENEILFAELSNIHDNIVHIVEQSACHKNGVTLEWVRYDISLSDQQPCKLSSIRDSCTRVSLPAPARAVSRAENVRLLTACIDGTLHVIHKDAGVTHSTRAGFIATEILCAGELIVAAEDSGRIQCFDRALTLLHHHAKCLDLTPYIRDSRRMQLLATRGVRGGRIIVVSLTGGPLTLLRMTHPRLITAWIRAGRISNAVSLLRCMDWDTEGSQCLWAVNALVVSALRRPLRCGVLAANGGEDSAQAALGAYLAPLAPHSPSAEKYAPAVHDLARKFFHHLLRRGRIEKALSLAVDLCAWDLFMDARWAAARLGLTQQAGEAASLAAHYALQQPESECSDSCSQCSSHSYSGSDYETSASTEPAKTKPPPLPRVPLPSTLLQVPITQTEPTSTNSIRPNLHQYLERDNTIWNTDVKEEYDRFKPMLTSQLKWHSVDNMLNYKPGPSKHSSLVAINEGTSRSVVEVIPRPQEERATATHFRHLFQTELREEAPDTIYRYHNTNYHMNGGSRLFKHTERNNRSGEKNKVKFSDTVTIAVVSDIPVAARELADSLPLCPPRAYLAAFAPSAPDNTAQKPPPKIKVVHFGMV